MARDHRVSTAAGTLVLLAHLFLAITTVTARAGSAPAGLTPLTLDEIRRLYNALVRTPTTNIQHVLHCSYWRRRHQYEPGKPTTSGNRSRNHEDRDLRLEY